MRNDIDKETYRWLFSIILFFAISLGLINVYLYSGQTLFTEKTLKFASSVFFLLIGVGLWIRLEYLKIYLHERYASRKLPMWTSAVVAVFAAFWRLFWSSILT